MSKESIAINKTCPWSGKPVSKDALTQYNGQTVGFCNPGCRDKFQRAIESFDACIQENAPRKTQ